MPFELMGTSPSRVVWTCGLNTWVGVSSRFQKFENADVFFLRVLRTFGVVNSRMLDFEKVYTAPSAEKLRLKITLLGAPCY